MSVQTFLLIKGDIILFEWNPEKKSRAIRITVEQTDYKAEYSQNSIIIADFRVIDTADFIIPLDGLYNILIENPSIEEEQIGHLQLFKKCVSPQVCQQSPFPERYYDYQLAYNGSFYSKQCRDWGYRTEFGAMIIEPYLGSEPLNLIFDSTTMDFDATELSPERITKMLFLKAKEGVKIVIQLSPYKLEGQVIVTEVHKLDSMSLWGRPNNWSYFIVNEDCWLKIESFVYNRLFGDKAELPTDFVVIKIYSDHSSDVELLNESYELLEVYNEVFNQYELEPVMKAAKLARKL
ncbi:hypothetical protein WBJ53_23280 [Spirosoma sp. SC4-14]|uniref:hypothetical protein n=1 Tax=Spirosoma sp. SC4-14 TaxID=3128900 RepID=UPI0030D3B03B